MYFTIFLCRNDNRAYVITKWQCSRNVATEHNITLHMSPDHSSSMRRGGYQTSVLAVVFVLYYSIQAWGQALKLLLEA